MAETILKQIAKDVSIVKEKVEDIEAELADIASDLHEVRPEYLERLKRIEKEGTISQQEFERKHGIKI